MSTPEVSAATGLQALFLQVPHGGPDPAVDDVRPRSLFAVLHEPPLAAVRRGAVLHFPAFAEEANKSRHMVAMTARALAGDGWTVLLPDWSGTGDSSGEFEHASWVRWRRDAAACLAWLRARVPAGPVLLWAHRAGCLLAAETRALEPLAARASLLFWQPVVQGRQHLQQLLRLKLAAGLARGDTTLAKDQGEALRRALAAGEVVEIGGYGLQRGIADGLEGAALTPQTSGPPGRLHWIEMASRSPAALLPASEKALQAHRDAGWHTSAEALCGPAFWQTVEIESAPALVGATVAAAGRVSDTWGDDGSAAAQGTGREPSTSHAGLSA